MRILIDTAQPLADRLRIALEGRDLTTELTSDQVDVACIDGDPERVLQFAQTRPDTAVLFFGGYTNITPLLEARVADVVPIDEDLETRLRIALTRIERESDLFEKRLVALFASAPDGVLLTTDHKIAYANRAFTEMLLDGGRAVVGRSCASLAHPDDAERIHHENEECLRTGVSSNVAECRLLRSDGSALLVMSVALPLTFLRQPSVLRFVRPQPVARELDDQMVLADRMASVGTLAAGVAHELNNPLAYVLANLQMVRESLDADSVEILEEVDTAIQGAHRMADIVRDLKTFARQPTTATEVVDVASALQSALAMCENELRHRGTLSLSIQESPTVEINASRLCQVFVNLLINAAHAIEGVDNGVVQVFVSTDERGWACIAIQDNGPGIPAEDMHRIFEPFFTTKAAMEGSGLGLSICRNLVTQAHGELHVESAPGSGAKFTIYLPPTTLKREVKRISSKPPSSSHLSILVIDDERLIGRAMKRALSGHQVTLMTDGANALQVLVEEKFDVIFCDLMMPGLSGMDVYRQAVERDPSLTTRFVFMTGGAFTPGARAFIAETSSLVIEKPFNLKQLRTIAADFVRSTDS